MQYYAHSNKETKQYQSVEEHLTNTAKLAAKFAGVFESGEIGYYTGLWHDIGKFNPDFTSYLLDENAHRGPDHSSAGAIYSLKSCDLLAIPIAGHHAGLANLVDLKKRIKDKSEDNKILDEIEVAKSVLDLEPASDISSHLPRWLTINRFTQELYLRMIFSCLVDADYCDTENFCDPQKSLKRRSIDYNMSDYLRVFTRYYNNLVATADQTALNHIRKEIYELCLIAAEERPGIFRLTVPTGGGKTLAGMGFALKHAVKNNLDRVIVAIPYTSIIEQNADVYRGIFGSERVLEYHSALNYDTTDIKSPIRLAADNWDAPIIVTTTVQLFESLFSNRPSKCRKIHNIAGSVIILDEVQTLPISLLSPILNMLQELVDHYHVSIVLCTATQPALDDSPYLKGLKDVREIIPDPERFFIQLKRVNYEIKARDSKWSWHNVAKEAMRYKQCLVVVNTKRDALKLLEYLSGEDVFHLSTLMCGAHRRATLNKVRSRLKDGLPCLLVSTQVVEAGVDLDFPVVMRAIGPLDRVVQVAGRCNREGKLKDENGNPILGKVIVFEPEEGGLPFGSYRSATDLARNTILTLELNWEDPELFRKYFNSLYQLIDEDIKDIQHLREKFSYKDVAINFKIIEDETVPVLVDYVPALDMIERFKQQIKYGIISRQLMREMQPYLVNVYQTQIPYLLNDSLIGQLADGIYEWKGIYNAVSGITDRSYDPESLIC